MRTALRRSPLTFASRHRPLGFSSPRATFRAIGANHSMPETITPQQSEAKISLAVVDVCILHHGAIAGRFILTGEAIR
jgi:hypothetical protein